MALSSREGVKAYGLWVRSVPRSGSGGELLREYGLDAEGIVRRVSEILK